MSQFFLTEKSLVRLSSRFVLNYFIRTNRPHGILEFHGVGMQDKIDITHLNAINPIRRHIVIKHALLRLWSQFYVFPVACTVVN